MPDQTNTNKIILKVDATISIDVHKNNAPADGKSVNTALAYLDNDGDLLSDVVFTFEITQGDAVFASSGKQKADIKANPAMFASADFIDTTGETGTIRVYPKLKNELVSAPASYTFKPGQLPKIQLAVPNNGAPANGKDFNLAIATLTHNVDDKFPGQKLTFSLPAGSQSKFATNLQTQLTTTTEANGTASAKIICMNHNGETVPLTCTLDSNQAVKQSCDLYFQTVSPVPATSLWPITLTTLIPPATSLPNTVHHWCEIDINRRSIADTQFTIWATSNTANYTIGDSNGNTGSSLNCYPAPTTPSPTLFVGTTKAQDQDIGVSLEVLSVSRGVIWRGIIYPWNGTVKETT